MADHILKRIPRLNPRQSNKVGGPRWTCLLIGLISAMFLPVGGERTRRCPHNGRLVLQPEDPLVFVGDTSTVCCHMTNPDGGFPPQTTHDLDLTCSNDVINMAVETPLQSVGSRINRQGARARLVSGSPSNVVCVNVTATAPSRGGLCTCRVPGRPDCEASRNVTVDEPLPANPQIQCVTYGIDNVTCYVTNAPNFRHRERVTSEIRWKQVGVGIDRTRTKICADVTSCVLISGRDLLLGFSLTFDIAVKMTYYTDTLTADVTSDQDILMTATSDWLTFDTEANVQLDPPRAFVVGRDETGFELRWPRQLAYFDDKLVNVTCVAMDTPDGQASFQQVVRESLDFDRPSVDLEVRGLQPSKDYRIQLRIRPVSSRLWSEPYCLTATTLPNDHSDESN